MPLEPENITGTTIVGEGITGTLANPDNAQTQPGVVNQGLYVSVDASIVIRNDCLSNMATCENMLSMMLWVNPDRYISASGPIVYFRNGIVLTTNSGYLRTWVFNDPYVLSGDPTDVRLPIDAWTHVAVVYDRKSGLGLYVNGSLVMFRSMDHATSYTAADGPFYIGSKAGHNFHRYHGGLDEIKFFYKRLTSSGEYNSTNDLVNVPVCV